MPGSRTESQRAPGWPQVTSPYTLARLFGRTPRGRFVVTYVLVAGSVMATLSIGELTNQQLLVWAGGVLATIATFVLITVTTWYRRENVVNAAILLALAWTLARLAGLGIAALALGLMGHEGGLGFGAIGGLFGLPVAVLEWILVSGVLVTLLRRMRAPVVSDRTGRESRPGGEAELSIASQQVILRPSCPRSHEPEER